MNKQEKIQKANDHIDNMNISPKKKARLKRIALIIIKFGIGAAGLFQITEDLLPILHELLFYVNTL
jgi:hypothetical protein